MKILYLTNRIPNQVSNFFKKEKSIYGGWIEETIDYFEKNNHIMSVFNDNKERFNIKINENFSFCSFKNLKNLKNFFKKILQIYKPDIIHIWGTEFIWSEKLLQAANELNLIDKCVISLQGIISEYAKVYNDFLPKKIINRYLFADLVRMSNLKSQQKNFYRRGESELNSIRMCKNFIGRTAWDRNCVYEVNKKANYYYCGETLRENFYLSKKWDYNVCQKNSIFICQSNYPIKGFHLALEIFNQLKKNNINFCVYTTGKNILSKKFLDILKLNSYQKFIRKKIFEYKLEKNIFFLGKLDQYQINDIILKTNLVLSPSIIENSPNSIGEALILGCPIVSSNVGGVSSIMSNKEGYLYELTNIDLATQQILKIFNTKENIFFKDQILRANLQYNKTNITKNLYNIYRKILNK